MTGSENAGFGSGIIRCDGGETGARSNSDSERFSPNGISESDGDYECNSGGCRSAADWDIELIDRHGQQGLVRACDDHVADVWGYHPEEES